MHLVEMNSSKINRLIMSCTETRALDDPAFACWRRRGLGRDKFVREAEVAKVNNILKRLVMHGPVIPVGP